MEGRSACASVRTACCSACPWLRKTCRCIGATAICSLRSLGWVDSFGFGYNKFHAVVCPAVFDDGADIGFGHAVMIGCLPDGLVGMPFSGWLKNADLLWCPMRDDSGFGSALARGLELRFAHFVFEFGCLACGFHIFANACCPFGVAPAFVHPA